MDHVVPDVVAEALAAVPGLAGALASHRPLAGRHPFHRPRVRWRRGQGEGGVLRRRPHCRRRQLPSVLLAPRVQLGGRDRVGGHGAAQKAGDQV